MSLKRLEPVTSCANRPGCYHSTSQTHVRDSRFVNQGQFKDPASHMCLAGAVVASWSLTQGVAGSNPFNDEVSVTWDRCVCG